MAAVVFQEGWQPGARAGWELSRMLKEESGGLAAP